MGGTTTYRRARPAPPVGAQSRRRLRERSGSRPSAALAISEPATGAAELESLPVFDVRTWLPNAASHRSRVSLELPPAVSSDGRIIIRGEQPMRS